MILGAAAIGEDPAKRKAQRRRELSMSDLIDLYEEEGCFIQRGKRQGEPMKELTRKYTLARLRHHVVPLVGKRRVGDILPGDIENFVRDVSNGKSAKDEKLGKRRRIIVRGGEPMALTGAILGHVNPRSTAIYAHVDHDPAKKSADRVSAMMADALAGASKSSVELVEENV